MSGDGVVLGLVVIFDTELHGGLAGVGGVGVGWGFLKENDAGMAMLGEGDGARRGDHGTGEIEGLGTGVALGDAVDGGEGDGGEDGRGWR